MQQFATLLSTHQEVIMNNNKEINTGQIIKSYTYDPTHASNKNLHKSYVLNITFKNSDNSTYNRYYDYSTNDTSKYFTQAAELGINGRKNAIDSKIVKKSDLLSNPSLSAPIKPKIDADKYLSYLPKEANDAYNNNNNNWGHTAYLNQNFLESLSSKSKSKSNNNNFKSRKKNNDECHCVFYKKFKSQNPHYGIIVKYKSKEERAKSVEAAAKDGAEDYLLLDSKSVAKPYFDNSIVIQPQYKSKDKNTGEFINGDFTLFKVKKYFASNALDKLTNNHYVAVGIKHKNPDYQNFALTGQQIFSFPNENIQKVFYNDTKNKIDEYNKHVSTNKDGYNKALTLNVLYRNSNDAIVQTHTYKNYIYDHDPKSGSNAISFVDTIINESKIGSSPMNTTYNKKIKPNLEKLENVLEKEQRNLEQEKSRQNDQSQDQSL